MQYLPTIDELEFSKIQHEILRRTTLLQKRECGYCLQPISIHTCKFKGREKDYFGDLDLLNSTY